MNSNARPRSPSNYIRFALRLRIPLAIATMVFAVIGLAANYAQVDLMLRPLGDRAATHPVTAVCLFGLGFTVLRLKRFGSPPWWHVALSGVIIAVCATRLMQFGLSQFSGAPPLAMFGPIGSFSGVFSVESAMTLGVFALAGLMRRGLGRWGIMCLIVGLATVFNTLVEISYGVTFFNGDVGAFSLLGLSCAAIAMTTAFVHRPFIRVGFLAGSIGHQTRVVGVAAVAVPWACGAVLHMVRDINPGAISYEAAMVSIITWSMVLTLLKTASHLEQSDVARRRAERDIAWMTRTDPKTGALNRFGLSERLDTAWVDFKTSGAHYGMMLLDVDYFRRLNDTFGQGGGDEVLERVATTIQDQLRDHDALGHWSSDEFLILLKIKARGDLNIVAHRLRAAFGDLNGTFASGLDGEPTAITATFGISEMQDKDQSPADMIVRADTALHFAKEQGGDQPAAQYELGEEVAPIDFADPEQDHMAA